MKRIIKYFGGAAVVGLLSVSQAFGVPGVQLQNVIDGITTAPVAGSSSVNVATDYVPDSSDSYWEIGGSGGSVATVVIELGAYANGNTLGIYDRANPASKVQVFGGAATQGSQAILSILANGSVILNFTDTGVDFAGNAFGLYLDSSAGASGGLFYSDTALNADQGDHMFAYQGVGDTIQIPPFSAGQWGPNEYILAFEDLDGSVADWNYTDMVVLVESVTPVPDGGATILMVGMALLGLAAFRRKA